MNMKTYVTTSNTYSNQNCVSNTTYKGRLTYNKQKGPVIKLQTSLKHKDDLFLLENYDKKEIIRIDHNGEIFLKGNNMFDSTLVQSMVNTPVKENINTFDDGIVIGKWKILPSDDGENLLIQKCVDGLWITKQHIH